MPGEQGTVPRLEGTPEGGVLAAGVTGPVNANQTRCRSGGKGGLFSRFLCCLGTGSAESGSPDATAENGDEEGNSPTH